MILTEEEYLAHYGTLRKSGRYPWGSGETPHQDPYSFLGAVKECRKAGMNDTEIARGFGMTTAEFRSHTSIANEAKKRAEVDMIHKLKEKGYSNVAISKKLGIPEPTVRNRLKPMEKDKENILKSTSDMLRNQVERKKYIDIGKGTELHLNISREKLKTAVDVLKDEGYTVHYIKVRQLGTGKETTIKTLAAPGTTYSEVFKNRDLIQPAMIRSVDGGRTFDRVMPPLSISSKRVKVRYAEEGGSSADGVIYVRRGVKDVSLGGSHYAQVRIAVDGTHYLKGMAIYHDKMPDGVDLVFNTNKSNTGNKLDAMKPMKDDPEDPFGANINDQVYKKNADGTFARDADGNKIVESAMNIVNKEGTWDTWSKTLSSQMLSKQKPTLAKEQLDIAYESKKREYDEIMAGTNPTLKKHLLEKFADSADASAVHLKAAHLPRQANKVILPVDSMKDNEVYAPTFRDGERVVLVRFPHGGKFEIPELVVNNRHPEAKRLIGPNAPDAIGINSKVAERLSGADFDGDTVLVIPNGQRKILTESPLEGLKGFDPQARYKLPEDAPRMNSRTKGTQMGLVSNLITDMTLLGAPHSELERAVKHSMVVIDAEKHHLDYRRSAIDHGIPQLMKKYQGRSQGGAATIISRAGGKAMVNDRKERPASEGGYFDKASGKRVYVETGAKHPDGSLKKIESKKLAETDDAYSLVSEFNTPMERIYADHSNRLKNLANQARKETGMIRAKAWSSSAKVAYAKEVQSLEAKVNLAMRNAPLERQAQIIGNAIVRQKTQANPEMEKAELKKIRSKALDEARVRTGAKKFEVKIEPREWEAIQAGAVSPTMLKRILENTDLDKIKELAMPKDRPTMSPAMRNRAVAMLRRGVTQADVADALGISVSALKSGISEGDKT